jgi:predicted DNA-binding transcriptional regulator YafY
LRIDAAQSERTVAELRGEATIVDESDDAIDVELTITNRAAFRAFVLDFLEHAEILEPPEIRADIVAWLAHAARRPPQPTGSGR